MMRYFLARLAAHFTASGLQLIHRQGTALPGLVATAIDPEFLEHASQGLPSVLVSGTNGKTTTTALLAKILVASSRSVVMNGAGSNLERGIASTLISSPLTDSPVAAFEVDEAELTNVAPKLRPQLIILMNLFRDQMDRYGELNTIAKRWTALAKLKTTELLASVDDPNLGWLAAQHRKQTVTFGITSVKGEKTGRALTPHHTADVVLAPGGTGRLVYKRISFSHLGDYHEAGGSFKRPVLDYAIANVKLAGLSGSSFELHDRKRRVIGTFTTPLPGLFNVYNVGAAAIAALELGISAEIIESAVSAFRGAFGRFETITLANGHALTTLLVKNPVGFDQALSLVATMDHVGRLILGVNDKIADGTDISWLWDVNFESLAAGRRLVVTTGTRAADLANRLKYAGLSPKRIQTEPRLDQLLAQIERSKPGSTVACLSYTAMLEWRQLLTQRGLLVHQFAATGELR